MHIDHYCFLLKQKMARDEKYLSLVPIFIVFYLFSSQQCCFAINSITPSQSLSQGETLISPGQVYELGFFSPNNSRDHQYVGIWYKGISPKTVVWVANREKPFRVTKSSATLKISRNGNLELVDGNHSTIWSTNVSVSPNSSALTLLDDGNLVLKDGKSGANLWQSFDHLTDTFLSGSVLGFNRKTGQKLVLTSWKTETDPSSGQFSIGVSSELRPAQAFIWNGTRPRWRTGPWGRLKFIGIPEMDQSYGSPFSLIEDVLQETTYLTFTSFNISIPTKMFISSEGVTTYLVKGKGNEWYTSWKAIKNACDLYGECGPNGVCKASESPICSCLKGFVPKSYQEWSKGNWTQGCQRKTGLLCKKNNTSPSSQEGSGDGFQKFGNMKLPDYYEYVFLASNATCRAWCQDNCSCLAYADVNGIGCLVWSKGLVDIQKFPSGGEDLFLRLAHAELVGGWNHNKIIIISLATVSSVVTLGAIIIGLHRWRAYQKRTIKETTEKWNSIQTRATTEFPVQHDTSELPIFDLSSILAATDNFSIENKLGQGGFGPVYKGILQDGKEIAVKRLSSSSGQGIEEFKTEMVLVSKLQHRNLVKLLGCCVEKEERLLIYEFMPNKSLDNFIFDLDPKRRAQFDWATRFNIINGIAKGLVYLHRDSCLRVIHRDLKVSNILLDEKMNPKISDFGLARIFDGTLDLADTRRIIGTLGYMSPEYALGGIFSEKSDVYSFGVLILEIVTGKKNSNFHYRDQHLSLVNYAWQMWSESEGVPNMVDKALKGSYSSKEAMRCIHVGLLCIQDHAIDRPSMPDVVFMLSNETDRPQPKQPLFTCQRSVQAETESKTSAIATMSIIEAR